MIRFRREIALACALLLPLLACARGGSLDTTLGTNGIVPVLDTVNDLNVVFGRAPDGKFIVVRNTESSVIVTRRLADGTADSTFGTGGEVVHGRAAPTGSPVGIVPLAVKRILFQGNKILLAGEATSACGTPGIARLNANGSVDINFGFRGWSTPVQPTRGIASCNLGSYFEVGAFRLLPDGRIALVAQPFEREMLAAMNGDHIAVRWSANGEHDAAYGGRGWVSGFSWYLQPGGERIFDDGSIVLARGELAPPGNVVRVTASRLSPSGERTDTVLPIVQDAAPRPPIVAIQADGAILVVRPSGVSRFVGNALDKTYGNGGNAPISPPGLRAAFATQDGGVLVVADSESAAIDGRNEAIVFLKLDAVGRPEPSFGTGGRMDLSASLLSEFPFQMALEDDGYLALFAYTTFRSGGDTHYSFYFTRVQAVPDVVEFENLVTRHYFIGYDNAEARGIDAGVAGAGWQRSGMSFRPAGPVPVCRFYTPVANSHFYTADATECALVKASPGWIYEGLGFSVSPPVDGVCSTKQRPVYRFYNNRAAQNDSNHRFLVNEALIPSMVERGWILEGIVFCAVK